MKLVFVLLVFVTACAPSGPHKPVGESQGKAGQLAGSPGYDSVKPIFAQYCAACHPSRSSPDWLDYSQASAYAKNGKLLRRIAIEKSMPPPGSPQAAAITEKDRESIANWARAGGPKDATPANAPNTSAPEPGPEEKLVQNCLRCHGLNGPDRSAEPRIPVLAGQNENYLASQLNKFKWRDRVDPSQVMNDVAIDLSPQDIQNVARFFASRRLNVKITLPEVADGERVLFEHGQRLAKRDCVSCHFNPEFGDRPTRPELPVLAGQSKIYLINQLVYFRGDERANPLMHEFARGLSNRDIEGLALYFSRIR